MGICNEKAIHCENENENEEKKLISNIIGEK
jgi:hypothetical protein